MKTYEWEKVMTAFEKAVLYALDEYERAVRDAVGSIRAGAKAADAAEEMFAAMIDGMVEGER